VIRFAVGGWTVLSTAGGTRIAVGRFRPEWGVITRSVQKNIGTSVIDEFTGALVVSWECSEITAVVRSFGAPGMAPVVKCVSVLLPPTQ